MRMKGGTTLSQKTTTLQSPALFFGVNFFAQMMMVVLTILIGSMLVAHYVSAKDLTGPSKQGTIIPCGNSNTSGLNSESTGQCKFGDLITFVSRFIRFSLEFMTAIATLIILYAGFLYLTSGALPEQRSEAKKIFWNIGKGFFFVAIAYMLVRFIVVGLVDPSLSSQIFN
jgi:hypothetical protein